MIPHFAKQQDALDVHNKQYHNLLTPIENGPEMAN